ncbi:hypothetical protein D3C75_449090 [compost metagenome]
MLKNGGTVEQPAFNGDRQTSDYNQAEAGSGSRNFMQSSNCRGLQLGLQKQVCAGISSNRQLRQHQIFDLLSMCLFYYFNNLCCIKLAVCYPQLRGSSGDPCESKIMHGFTYPFYK